MPVSVHPLIFEPILKPRLWGGRELGTLLGKRLPAGMPIGESWEIADLDEDRSVVATGPLKGRTLSELLGEWGEDLTGRAELREGRFPLLIKFLDAVEALSVQVHPDAAAANRMGGGVRPKTEAWYVIHAQPGACIYRGLRQGVDERALRAAIADGRVEETLLRIPAKTGNAYFLPAGTIHALGAGVVVAEVQTPSDVTYRFYDWGRIDPTTGRPRPVHVEEALACLSYDPIPPQAETRQHLASVWTAVTALVRCDAFVMERVRMVEGVVQPIPHQELVIWIVLQGRGSIAYEGPGSPLEFNAGDTVLIPAALKGGRVETHERCLWLEVTVPIPSALAGFAKPEREKPMAPRTAADRYVPMTFGGKPVTQE
jgi:mannose-6-phosphate isomerase